MADETYYLGFRPYVAPHRGPVCIVPVRQRERTHGAKRTAATRLPAVTWAGAGVRRGRQEDGAVVGVAGFEPTAFRSQSGRATKLRHTPCWYDT